MKPITVRNLIAGMEAYEKGQYMLKRSRVLQQLCVGTSLLGLYNSYGRLIDDLERALDLHGDRV